MKKRWSEIKYWVVVILILAVLFELVASMILFRKYTPAKSAALHIISSLVSKHDPEQYTYEPWMMFRIADYHSKDININGFERKSVPDSFIRKGQGDTIDVYFFGGNTMFGERLTDSETIPSKFVSAYESQNPSNSLRVKNFGIPHYYSKQELMLLTSLVFKGDRPDVVVFLDGLNDFYPARMLYYDRPFFSYALQQSFEGKMFQQGRERFVDSTDQLFNDPPGVSSDDYNNALISKYTNNIKMAANLCETAGIKCYFFCEPVSNRQMKYKGNINRLAYIYAELKKNKDSLPSFRFLGNMRADPDAIANEILSTIKNDLR